MMRDIRYTVIKEDSEDPGYNTRFLIATPTTGLIRMEWAMSRWGQIVPTNWSMVQMVQFVSGMVTMNYLVADAQNLIVKETLDKQFEWLFLLEHDVILPPNALILLNEYLRNPEVPVVSGLYFTRSRPSEPLLYRGRGTSYYEDWELGDKVWVDGVPTGCLLIHSSILKLMWEDSVEYTIAGNKLRKVFHTPTDLWIDPETGQFNSKVGTSDLEWCTKVMEGKYLAKAGWPEIQEKEFPFLVDTRIFCKHINPNGEQFP